MIRFFFFEDLQNQLYRHFLGDKEMFWLAGALAEVPFSFNPYEVSMVGFENHANGVCHVCGDMAHFVPDLNDTNKYILSHIHGHNLRQLYMGGGKPGHVADYFFSSGFLEEKLLHYIISLRIIHKI